jgi:asparagine synthase (glutamine-hydrolysing)
LSIIAGMVDWSCTGAERAVTGAMLAVFRQQCPDGVEVRHADICALGIGLLKTTRSTAQSHGLSESGDILIAIEGRLSGAGDLRTTLGIGSAATDAESVAEGFRRWDVEVFSHLRGDFAVLIWERKSRRLIAARDPFATRPLFYAARQMRCALASDPEQIMATGLVPLAPDDDMVLDYLMWDMRLSDRSFIRDVKALPPGQVLVVTDGEPRLSPYRPACLTLTALSERQECWERYRVAFDGAVRSSIESSHPVVAELSGGLDSTSIVCAADRLLEVEPDLCPSFISAAGLFPGLDCDEAPFIEAVARTVRVPVQRWDATRGCVDELENVSPAVPGGRVFMNGGSEGQVEIARSHGARIIVSGIGGDQTGTSAGTLRDAVAEGRWADARRILLDRPGATRSTIARSVWKLARSFAPTALKRIRRATRRNGPRPPWMTRWAQDQPRSRPMVAMPPELKSEVHRQAWQALVSPKHSQMMAYAQHHAIRSAIDLRFPFLDSDLVGGVLSIPPRYWPPAWPGERLHREILRDLLPPAIVRRRTKANFSSALAVRVRRHLPAIRDIFAKHSWASERFVDPRAARAALSHFEQTETPSFWATYAVWAIVTLETWMAAVLRYPVAQTLGAK